MNKIFALFLTVVMCFALVACGDTPVPAPGNENSDSDSGSVSDSGTSEPSGQEESSKPTIPAYLQRWFDRMQGTWFAVDKEGLVCESFTIDSKQNITINNEIYGMSLTTQESWGWASIDVLKEDGTKAYDMRIDLRDGGWSTMSFIYQDKNGTYYREDQVEVVELTKDNWLDYFEPGEYVGIGLNAFNEYERMFVQTQYRLKEQYSHLIPEISSGAIECSIKDTERKLEVFPSEKRYVWGEEPEKSTPHTYKSVLHIDEIIVEEKDGKQVSGFGFGYATFGLYNLEETFTDYVDFPELEEVHRLSATLYFYTGKE